MARKRKEDTPPPGAPGWMTTYGDLMSLLLCFFVLLVSMSTMEIEKFKAAAASLRGAFSVLPFQEAVRPRPVMPKSSDAPPKADTRKRGKAIMRLRQIIREKDLTGLITVQQTEQGVHITIGDPALFDSGQATIKSEMNVVLDAIVEVVQAGTGTENIRVEGHTDNIPIHNAQFDDNWELSISRSLSVIRYIRGKEKIDPQRLRPVGCGEFHPIASNQTPEGRARNRRVEIYIEMQ